MHWVQKASNYWYTVRYLRAVQIYGRIWFCLWRPRPDMRPAPPRNQPLGQWQIPAQRQPSMSGPRSWKFLNQVGQLDEVGWNGYQREKLWRYNQHYFDDLNAINATDRSAWHIEIIENWITHNPPGIGNGWESYPLSLRITNWIKWAALDGMKLSDTALRSLAIQVRYLAAHLEHHLLGNHLFSNAKALVMAGLFFNGPEADLWLSKGLKILAKEVPEQILDDGGHFERSTMYHALILEDMLDLINAAKCFANRFSSEQRRQVDSWSVYTRKLYDWLLIMCHPDGEISLFNDAAFGISPSVAELQNYAARLLGKSPTLIAPDLIHLKDSGYIRVACGSAVAIMDVAPIGPDYLPGHAHADTLSFELSVGKQRLLVNSGTSYYGDGVERLRQRGTAAHNTVTINHQNSSEVWSSFRVARRAYPVGLEVTPKQSENIIVINCAHNGYSRLPGKPMHHRRWQLSQSCFVVTDWIEGPYQTAEARFHFHPSLRLQINSNQTDGTITLPDSKVLSWRVQQGLARIDASTWHPEFGHTEPNICLVIKLIHGSSSWQLQLPQSVS